MRPDFPGPAGKARPPPTNRCCAMLAFSGFLPPREVLLLSFARMLPRQAPWPAPFGRQPLFKTKAVARLRETDGCLPPANAAGHSGHRQPPRNFIARSKIVGNRLIPTIRLPGRPLFAERRSPLPASSAAGRRCAGPEPGNGRAFLRFRPYTYSHRSVCCRSPRLRPIVRKR